MRIKVEDVKVADPAAAMRRFELALADLVKIPKSAIKTGNSGFSVGDRLGSEVRPLGPAFVSKPLWAEIAGRQGLTRVLTDP